MELLYFILICFGMTQILVYGSIFDKIRPKHKFFHCTMCVGFHVGYVVWLIGALCGLFIYSLNPFVGFLLACLSSGTSYVLCQLFGDEGIKIDVKSD